MSQAYCNSLTTYSRRLAREVKIGDVPLGSHHPIRVQSMTTTDTMDTNATVEQSIRMIDAGCEYVRITAPSKAEAENLGLIKKELRKRGYQAPLIADIHFTPNAAEIAARLVEKVRINPGNFADKKRFEVYDYTESEYQAELDRIRERFTPLVKICKEYGTAMRIGTNHGSLSDRILNRYGDTPQGMVESAMEFLEICRENNYHQIVLSMKASNTLVMIQAYRLLVNRMNELGMDYPLHLGVTEAGEGEDGRIKSALGIGTLLEDGIGDTIRVSLTEDPEFEIPVAKALVSRYSGRSSSPEIEKITNYPVNPFAYKRRETRSVLNVGGGNVPVVVADYSLRKEITPASFFALGYRYDRTADKWHIGDQACDYVFVNNHAVDFEIPGTLGIIMSYRNWLNFQGRDRFYPLLTVGDYLSGVPRSGVMNVIYCNAEDLTEEFCRGAASDDTAVLMLDTGHSHGMAAQRRMFVKLMEAGSRVPVIIGRAYADLPVETLQLHAATDMGALLADGLGDGIFVAAERCGSDMQINQTAFGILQAARTRISKTEYISCPSCGRTLFDLQETTARIRSVTSHLKGVKIGIMGCIVNGPGEMADADYGYVGTGAGKISLYKGMEVVKRNIPSADAVNELIELIRSHGDWVDVPEQ